MDVANLIKTLIAEIPTLLEYFIPGYCTIYFYKKINNAAQKAGMSEQIHIGACVIVSYFILSLGALIGQVPFLKGFTLDIHLRCALETVLGCALAAVLTKLLRTAWARKMFNQINSTTLSPTAFECSNLDRNTPKVTVYTDDGGKIEARMLTYDDPGDDRWFAVDLYKVYDKKGNVIDDWTWHDNYSRRLIPFEKTTSIDVHYDEGATIAPEGYEDLRRKLIAKANCKCPSKSCPMKN